MSSGPWYLIRKDYMHGCWDMIKVSSQFLLVFEWLCPWEANSTSNDQDIRQLFNAARKSMTVFTKDRHGGGHVSGPKLWNHLSSLAFRWPTVQIPTWKSVALRKKKPDSGFPRSWPTLIHNLNWCRTRNKFNLLLDSDGTLQTDDFLPCLNSLKQNGYCLSWF